jgi:predicted nucleic acid-binding protein
VSVLDTSAAVDYLLGRGAAREVSVLLREPGGVAAPDVMVFEVLAVLRRHALRGAIDDRRAGEALADLEAMPVEWFRSMTLRERAWALRANMAPADALFVALADVLGERLVTKDAALAANAARSAGVEVQHLSDPSR